MISAARRCFCIANLRVFVLVGACAISLGCAARFESPAGSTWIVGMARISTSSDDFGGGHSILKKVEQEAPISFGVEPYGLRVGIGMNANAVARILSKEAAKHFVPVKMYGIPIGAQHFAWNIGLTRHTFPRSKATVKMRYATVRGLSTDLNFDDSSLKMGFSRSTLVSGEATNAFLNIEFSETNRIPQINAYEQPTIPES